MSTDEPDDESVIEKARRRLVPLEWPSDPAFFERTDFTWMDVLEGLQRCFLDEGQHPEAVEFLSALRMAVLGTHPFFRLRFERVPKGKSFAPYAKMKRHLLATNLAEQIDIAVARGAKLEAEIQDACDAYGLSRREVFRFLKETRERRLAKREIDALDGRGTTWPIPNDLTLDKRGRFVTIVG